jgi:alpha-ribazole phosphatase
LSAASLVCIRHPAPAIAPGRCYGRLDVALREPAQPAIDRILHDLRDLAPSGVWSSPAQRCRRLAAAIAEASGAPLRLDPRLWELDFGAWEGRDWAAIPRAEIDAWAAAPLDFAPPGGESVTALLARLEAFLAALDEIGGDRIVVTHGGPLRLLPALIRGEPPDPLAPAPAFGAIIRLARRAG